MSIATAITAAQGKVANAYTAVSNKGGTLPATQNLSNLPTAISSIPSGGGGGGSGTRDVELARFKDDNNTEIGTWYMNFVDGSGNEFKVICLDAQYRNASTQWSSRTGSVTNLPLYSDNLSAWWYDNAKETATQNTQLILDWCSKNAYTSTACSHCRSNSYVIGGTTYYGQLPNMREVFDMWRHRVQIEQMDTSASGHSSTNFNSARNIWSSSQCGSGSGWYLVTAGLVYDGYKSTNFFASPVLEIPV